MAKEQGRKQSAEFHKQETADFKARDETSSAFGHDVQKSGTDSTFGHDVQKSGGDFTSGQDVQKSEFQNNTTQGAEEQKKQNNYTEQNNQDSFTNQSNNSSHRSQDSSREYRQRDTYHRSNPKSDYHRKRMKKAHQTNYRSSDYGDGESGSMGATSGSEGKEQKATSDTFHADSNSFTGGGTSEFMGSKKLDRLDKKAQKVGNKLDKTRQKIPKKTEYTFKRVFDEETGQAKYVIAAIEKDKPFKKAGLGKQAAQRLSHESRNKFHGKIAEVEKENSAVEGAHKTEQKVEDVYGFVKRHHKSRHERTLNKVAKLEKKQFKADVNFRYQKFLEENPEMQKKKMQKLFQKKRIKKEYAKAKRAGAATKSATQAVQKTASKATAVAKKLQEIAAQHASLIVAIGIFAILLIIIMTSVSSCGAMFSNSVSTTMAGSYISVPAELDAVDSSFTEKEMNLQEQIDSIESDYPGYDEYSYNIGAIGHNPFTLINYLSAKYMEFTASAVESEVQSLFDAMYTLTITPTTETRTRTVTNEETGEEEEEEYEVSVLKVVLSVTPLESLVTGRMDAEQSEMYAMYGETRGLLQMFSTPVDLYWYNYISSYYGYRKNPNTGNREFHRGLDIAVPTGTPVKATHEGTITVAAYDSYYGNYVEITNSKGYVTKYAHMDSLSVSVGQSVTTGTPLGTTGNTGSSTGSHLHIECLYNGEYYNPLFYFDVGTGTLYGETPGGGGGDVIPPDAYDDASVQALMEEAARYLGYPYVWGGSSPSTSFDCSGFVCWVFTNSGVHNLPRTTAQGIYDQCSPVSASDAKAGDIIFFTGTYASSGPVSHVGIYCGNGVMIHCGDPISYASVNSPYWQSHFYSYGRLN